VSCDEGEWGEKERKRDSLTMDFHISRNYANNTAVFLNGLSFLV
jgi:hypothetical protein